jgi:hypothetical protein
MFTGCSSRSLYDGLGAGVGGLAGYHFSDGNPYITAASAAGGVIVAEAIQNSAEKGKAEVFKQGYDKGQSDAVKRQYWIARNLHKKNPDDPLTYYSIPIEPEPNADIQLVPHERTLSFVE